MRKILFLDVDGVLNDLNVLSTREELGESHLINFKNIVSTTNCEIVLSSTWRLFPETKSRLETAFVKHNIPLWTGETPVLKSTDFSLVPRKNEILMWLESNVSEVAKVVVIDDESDANLAGHKLPNITDIFIHTCMNHGLTASHVKNAVNFLL